jgi:hypothetical protein
MVKDLNAAPLWPVLWVDSNTFFSVIAGVKKIFIRNCSERIVVMWYTNEPRRFEKYPLWKTHGFA